MPLTNIDIERRLELATQELIAACTVVTALTTADRVVIRNDTTHAADYPSAAINVMSALPFGYRTGWYQCALQLSALTYHQDDESRSILKQIAGALRGFAQQTDLHTQYNATVIAKAAATALDVREAWLDGNSFDASEDKIQEWVVPVAVLCRPTQAVTTT